MISKTRGHPNPDTKASAERPQVSDTANIANFPKRYQIAGHNHQHRPDARTLTKETLGYSNNSPFCWLLILAKASTVRFRYGAIIN